MRLVGRLGSVSQTYLTLALSWSTSPVDRCGNNTACICIDESHRGTREHAMANTQWHVLRVC
jgi:hypothetical protein